MNFLEELKRRHVYRVAAAYAVVGWLLIQVATQVFPVFHLPDWIDQAVVLLILIGFPIALVLAWAFDATGERDEGVYRIMGDLANPDQCKHNVYALTFLDWLEQVVRSSGRFGVSRNANE